MLTDDGLGWEPRLQTKVVNPEVKFNLISQEQKQPSGCRSLGRPITCPKSASSVGTEVHFGMQASIRHFKG